MPFIKNADWANTSDDPYAAPLGTWVGEVIDVEVFGKGLENPDEAGIYIKLVWQKDKESSDPDAGNTFDDIFTLHDPGLDQAAVNKKHSFLKKRFVKDIGVPEDSFNEAMEELNETESVDPVKELVLGFKAVLTTARKEDWTNIKKIAPVEPEPEESLTQVSSTSWGQEPPF